MPLPPDLLRQRGLAAAMGRPSGDDDGMPSPAQRVLASSERFVVVPNPLVIGGWSVRCGDVVVYDAPGLVLGAHPQAQQIAADLEAWRDACRGADVGPGIAEAG